EPLDLWTSGVK
nr:immunoglobulin heavy chain junction region [Mus musculus]